MAIRELTAYSSQGPVRLGSKYRATVMQDKPIVFWGLDEPSGTTMIDQSGNGRDGTYSGATLGSTANVLPEFSASALGSNTTGQGVGSIASATWMNVSAISVCCWVQPSNTTNFKGYVSRYSTAAPGHWLLGQTSGGFLWDIATTGADHFMTAGQYALTKPYFLCGLYDGGTQSLYINGGLAASTPLSGGLGGSISVPIQVGGYNGGNYSNSIIGPVAIFDKVLDPHRIAAQYNAGITLTGL